MSCYLVFNGMTHWEERGLFNCSFNTHYWIITCITLYNCIRPSYVYTTLVTQSLVSFTPMTQGLEGCPLHAPCFNTNWFSCSLLLNSCLRHWLNICCNQRQHCLVTWCNTVWNALDTEANYWYAKINRRSAVKLQAHLLLDTNKQDWDMLVSIPYNSNFKEQIKGQM